MELEPTGLVVADSSAVPRAKTQTLAGDKGRGDLPSRLPGKRHDAPLATKRREFPDHQDRVRGIQSKTCNVNSVAAQLFSPVNVKNLDATPEALSPATEICRKSPG